MIVVDTNSRAESPKAYSPGYHPEVRCIELITSCKDKSIWLLFRYICFCPCRAHTYASSYPGRLPWAMRYCPCGAYNLAAQHLKRNSMDNIRDTPMQRTANKNMIATEGHGRTRFFRWKEILLTTNLTNETNELNKTMNASVLRIKQIYRHQHVAYLC